MPFLLPRDCPWNAQLGWYFLAARWTAILFAYATTLFAVGCATTLQSSAPPESTTVSPPATQASSDLARYEPIDLSTSLAEALAAGPPIEAPCGILVCPAALSDSVLTHAAREFHLENDTPLRPPLRQTWFQHPKLVPLGDDVDFDLPHSEILAHRDPDAGHFRNPYAGLRDQAILHRDTSRAPATDSTLPDVGPPPPRHTLKTFGTLTGLSLIGIGVYAWAPTSLTGADKQDEWKEARDHFKEAWTKPPVFDKDKAAVNFLGHPYFGMNFYLSQRNYGESPLYSFLFSALTSTCFEYFIESWSERPSVQDLLITPIVGSILGELVFRATQEMRKDGFTTAERVLVTVINPLYVLQNGYR